MYTVGLILEAPFQTLSSGLQSKHSWEEYISGDLSQHFFSFLIPSTYLDIEISPSLMLSFDLSLLRSPFSYLIPSPLALFAEGVKWYWGTLLTHPPPSLLPPGPALLNILQHGQKARHQVRVTESGSVVVDKLFLNQGQGCSETSMQHITIC